jgi:hypothetical protein
VEGDGWVSRRDGHGGGVVMNVAKKYSNFVMSTLYFKMRWRSD